MAECNAAKTLDNAVLEGYDTDVMTGDYSGSVVKTKN